MISNQYDLHEGDFENQDFDFSPLLHIGHYSVRMPKISILKYEWIKKKSYERCVNESADDNSLSYALSQKPTKKELMQQRVKKNQNHAQI